VTLCTYQRAELFGDVVDGLMALSPYGEVVWEEWFKTGVIRPYVRLDETEFVVMPNHIHGIIWIIDAGATRPPDDARVGATRRVAPTGGTPTPPKGPAPGSIGAIIGQFKSAVTKRINALRGTPGAPVWQRNYYEHIIRDEQALAAIRRYITANPARWDLDRNNAVRRGDDPLVAQIWRYLQGSPPSQEGVQ
jgi:REP element-mobilizing transposase RayT